MNENIVAAASLLPAATFIAVLGVQMRAGRWLHLINGIDLSQVRDREGLGLFVGTSMMALAAVLVFMTAALALLPKDILEIAMAVCGAAIVGVALRLAFGVRGFQRR